MIPVSQQTLEGWHILDYRSSYPLTPDWILCAGQVLLEQDFRGTLQRFATAENNGDREEEHLPQLQAAGYHLEQVLDLQHAPGVITFSGISQQTHVPIQLTFYTGTRTVRLFTNNSQIFQANDMHVFDHYMDTLEIAACVRDALKRHGLA